MPAAGVTIVTAAVVWATAGLALSWGGLSGRGRRAVALVASMTGLVTLMVALGAHGQREALTTGQFLVGGAYVTGHASASASLRYHVMTAVCLLLGTVGLALPDDAARALHRHRLAMAVALSLGVTALRFALDKVAAPHAWTYAVGITWLPPIVGAMFFLRLREQGKGVRALVGELAAYGVAVRGAVALLMVIATRLGLGSHYDLSAVTRVRFGSRILTVAPGSAEQLLYLGVLPQITFWVAATVVAGLLGAAVAAAVLWARRGQRRTALLPAEPAAAAGRES